MEGLFLGHITSLLSEDPQPQQSPQEDGLAPKAQDQLHHSSIGRWPRPVMCQDILKSDYTSRKLNKAFPHGLAEDTDTERENGSFGPYEMPIFMSKMMALDHFIWCNLSCSLLLSDRNMRGCCLLFAFNIRKGCSAEGAWIGEGAEVTGCICWGALVTKEEEVDCAREKNFLEQTTFRKLSRWANYLFNQGNCSKTAY